MSRDFTIAGESLVYVKGRSDSAIGTLQQLALPYDAIRVTPVFKHKDINVDAWGEAPADVQWMLAEARIRMNVVHVDTSILQTCVQLSMGGGASFGSFARAGTRMGGNLPRFSPGNNYISLNIAAPIDALPWRFFFCYLSEPPFEWPLGTEKSIITLNWRCVPYVQDPANIVNGVILGATGYQLWDRGTDS